MTDDTANGVENEDSLRALYPPVSELARMKQIDRLDRHARAYIKLSPFLLIGSMRPGCGMDVSPRGDPPGFVAVVDDRTLVIPDRPGNNRLDTLSNLVEAAEVGLLFMIPGIEMTLRVNGKASLTQDPVLLRQAEINGKRPRLAIKVVVSEVFFHCAKALRRAKLWEEDHRQKPGALPSIARIICEQTGATHVDVDAVERTSEERLKTHLY
ncbi:MAG: pyridoxamine 5'-phosphate oxidase family protein [Proteobacteria bacterium]|nr:pyridoxamine 5'-phosphate oxidase family protein [Pseudomonadota bacterium]MBI3497095.1 pyridoxamine 5'-phosphate oxidase family protein [Pseudomonadota bacterium]